jgi:hypothetical protein
MFFSLTCYSDHIDLTQSDSTDEGDLIKIDSSKEVDLTQLDSSDEDSFGDIETDPDLIIANQSTAGYVDYLKSVGCWHCFLGCDKVNQLTSLCCIRCNLKQSQFNVNTGAHVEIE